MWGLHLGVWTDRLDRDSNALACRQSWLLRSINNVTLHDHWGWCNYCRQGRRRFLCRERVPGNFLWGVNVANLTQPCRQGWCVLVWFRSGTARHHVSRLGNLELSWWLSFGMHRIIETFRTSERRIHVFSNRLFIYRVFLDWAVALTLHQHPCVPHLRWVTSRLR